MSEDKNPAEEKPAVRVRMYRQGLGDCFLVTFSPEGEKPVHMLIDCGTLGTTQGVQMQQVIKDIQETTGNHIDVLVVTHEHQDHVSGFTTTLDEKKMFDDFAVDQVWLAWTEDITQLECLKLKKEHDELKDALKVSVETLWNNASRDAQERQALREVAASVRDLLRFSVPSTVEGGRLGVAGRESGRIGFADSVDAAMDYASGLAKKRYLFPGQAIEGEIKGWRFYVLGPPQNKTLLNRDDDKKGSLYHSSSHLAADISANASFFGSNLPAGEYRSGLDADARQQFDTALPFDPIFRIDKDTRVPGRDKDAEQQGMDESPYQRLSAQYELESWRCIDYDWLGSAEDFALQLDNAINNTSLVLAMEHIADGRVLLFPGDAQLGNWQCWDGTLEEVEAEKIKKEADKKNPKKIETYAVKEFRTKEKGSTVTNKDGNVVTPADLLKRTVFYKVGHHASHNATTKKGLEAMGSEDLVAVIPLDSAIAAGRHPGWNFPNDGLYPALLKATKGRVIRSDVCWPNPEDQTQKGGRWDSTTWIAIAKVMEDEKHVHLWKKLKEDKRQDGPDKTKTYVYQVYEDDPGKKYKIKELLGYVIEDDKVQEDRKYIDYLMY